MRSKKFSAPEGKEVLLCFLNDVLQLPSSEEIIDLTFEDRKLDPDFAMERGARIDLLTTTSKGVMINIEVQVANEFNIDRRTLFYWSRLYHIQPTQGQKYADLRQTVMINIIDFNWFSGDERMHRTFHIADYETGTHLCNLLEIHFPELKKEKSSSILQKAPSRNG